MCEVPLPAPTVARKPFASFKVISYDIYGTLVDWESGILPLLRPLADRIPQDSDKSIYRSAEGKLKLADKFNQVETAIQTDQPSALYTSVLEQTYLRIAEDFGIEVTDAIRDEAKSFGASIRSWPAFADTVDACQRLVKAGFKLVPLSNVDRESFSQTRAGPLNGVEFFRVYTAQDIGSYKPDLRNFDYLLRKLKEDAGVDQDEILHVAQSLYHDHVPAKKMGLSSVWINRKGAGMGSPGGVKELHEKGEVGYGWRFATLGELADEVERQAKDGN